MDVQHSDNGQKGKFYILVDDKEAAEMTYTWAGSERIIIDHTDVNEILRGKNAGKQMVMEAVEFAREKGIKVIPLCPFANSVFQKTPEITDVL
jgi:uncharacterized protein